MIKIDFPPMNFFVQGIEDVTIPKMVRIREKYEDDKIDDIKAHLVGELDGLDIDRAALKGKSIAITVGSRGKHPLYHPRGLPLPAEAWRKAVYCSLHGKPRRRHR